MIAVLNWLVSHWYVFFWLSFFGVFARVRDFFVGVAKALGSFGDRRHARAMREIRLRALLEAGYAPATQTASAAAPGPCAHRRVVPVIAADETVAAWLCRGCDTQLPADWAVRAEDL